MIPNPFLQLIHQAVKNRVESCEGEISGVSIEGPLNHWQIQQYKEDGKRCEYCNVCERYYGEEENGSCHVLVLDVPGIQVCLLCQFAVCELVFAHLGS